MILASLFIKSSQDPEGMECKAGEVLLQESWEKKAYKCGEILGSSPREDQQAGSFCLG